ncbi:hypothetical protein [Archangium sp. Cb G35]|uniref:hypothetical protein n=1 Tax=Archangium sp. Cb G35 TaxID=1920190 RepID=UPI0011613411|nr:hypothetical protein [Archangium sp. Cb G35]
MKPCIDVREHSGRSAVQGALVLVLALSLPFAASAENEGAIRGHIISINSLYENLEYELALGQVKLARQLLRSADDEVTLSLYEGIILCEMGKQDLGASLFRAALLLRPGAKLPVQVAPKVNALFESVRMQVKQEAASILPPSGTEKPSTRAEQNREAPPPDAPDTDKQPSSSPTASEGGSTPEAQQESHADKDQAPARVEREELSNEWLMKRLLRLQGKFLQGESPSKRVPLRELDKIGQQIRAAHTTESLREAAHALDAWQQRHLAPSTVNARRAPWSRSLTTSAGHEGALTAVRQPARRPVSSRQVGMSAVASQPAADCASWLGRGIASPRRAASAASRR